MARTHREQLLDTITDNKGACRGCGQSRYFLTWWDANDNLMAIKCGRCRMLYWQRPRGWG